MSSFADLALARRLERAEGFACREFAEARRRLFPETGSEWMEHAGAWAVFDGVSSPATQTFGLGIFEELTGPSLDTIERFFLDRGAHVDHEVSPLAGVAALGLLCARRYRPIEIASVMCRATAHVEPDESGPVTARVASPGETQLWADISSRGWSHEHPELGDLFKQFNVIAAARERTTYFLADFEGQTGAAGALCIHEGVALFGGSATVPELRGRGLQAALLRARLRYAFDRGCDLAMMVAEAGSGSQRNAERQGFGIAYTRMKWRLSPS